MTTTTLPASQRLTVATMLPARWTRMGVSEIRATIGRPSGRGATLSRRLLVGARAIYSVLPAGDWRALGLRPLRTVEFSMADGTAIERKVSEARFTIQGLTATSPVVLGEVADAPLLGAVTLETLGFMVPPAA